MKNDHPTPPAEQKIAHHLDSLQSKHAAFMQEAFNKTYALEFACDSIEAELSKLPQLSHLFQLLVGAQYHHLQLSGTWSFADFCSRLEELREPIKDAMEPALLLLLTSDQKFREQLTPYYRELLDQQHSINDIIVQERFALACTPHYLFEMITYHRALILFKAELEQEDAQTNEVVAIPKFGFTRSQQVLVFYYLLRASGVAPRLGANITDCALLLHHFLRISVSDIANSDLYKKLKRPLEHSSPSKTIQNLLAIRPFFERLSHHSILEMIDKDLKRLGNSLQ